MKNLQKLGVLALIVLVIAVSIYALQQKKRADVAEADVPIDTGKVLSAIFEKKGDLRVLRISGTLVVTAKDEGFAGIISSTQKRQFPYSADYFVDLSKIDRQHYRWSAEEKTMTVELPDVEISRPNIDASKGKGDTADGLWVTRQAHMNLQQKLSARSVSVAAEEAKKPENLEKARRAAREQIQKLIGEPLKVAGLGDIVVVTRFPWETGGVARERWDESTPLSQIVGQTK